jgi:hypothetical protein
MAQKVRNSGSAPMYALIKAFNALRVGLVSTNPHVDVTSKDTSADFANPSTTPDVPSTVADPTTTAGVIALHNECIDIYGRHLADAVAHKAVDATNVYTTKIAVGTVDGSGVYTPLNAFKASIQPALGAIRRALHGRHDLRDRNCRRDYPRDVESARRGDRDQAQGAHLVRCRRRLDHARRSVILRKPNPPPTTGGTES